MDNTKKIMTVKELKARIPEVINAIPKDELQAKGLMPYVVFSYMGTDGKEHNVKPRRCGGGYLYDGAYHQTKDRVFRIEYCINDLMDAKIVLEGFQYEYLLIHSLLTSISRSMIFSSDILNAPVCFSYRTYAHDDTVLIGIHDCVAEDDEEGHIVLKLKASPDKRYDFDWENLSDGSGFDFAFASEYCEYLEWLEEKKSAEKDTMLE
ncbi:hypothetical protein [Cloacibacillus sp. An23]|uniref:hypothetical protein n=1 Tax=Cloacibacillus sp. An23 TaxID=1965591 RepID=UPI000B36FD72|nr:hypothetical protein [Cloacibacillus sp. An23]OUO94834.1 hypothetical protein B5F39_02910 [Cloacibacillus sp. An23]